MSKPENPNIPGVITVVVEIPTGSKVKYEYNAATDTFDVDFIFQNIIYPFNYGFIPDTMAGDGDTLDAIVLSKTPLAQGSAVQARVLGMVEIADRGERDNKIIAIPVGDSEHSNTHDLADLTRETVDTIRSVFEQIAIEKKKDMKVGNFKDKESAFLEIKICRSAYQD